MNSDRVRSLTIYVVAIAGIIAAGGYLASLPQSPLDDMRRDFVALMYFDQARSAIRSRPMRPDKAVHKLSKAIELAGDHPVIRSGAPMLFWAAGSEQAALKLMRKQNDPDPYLLGACLLELGHKQRGAKLLRGMVRKATRQRRNGTITDSQYAMQLNNVGYLFADANVHLDEAKSMLETATRHLPLEPNCADSLGWLCFRMGNYHDAAFYLQRAIRHLTGPGEAEIFYHLGATYHRLGLIKKAEKMLQKAVHINPTYKPALRELKKLRWMLPKPSFADVP